MKSTELAILSLAGLLEACGQPPGEESPGLVATPATYSDGLDVSSYQGYNDWSAIKMGSQCGGHPCVFAWAKAVEGTSVDPAFYQNWAHMFGNVQRGLYLYFHPGVSGKAQADYLYRFIQNSGGMIHADLAPMLDMETLDSLSGAQAGQEVTAFLDEWHAKLGSGAKVYIYTYTSLWNSLSNLPADIGSYPLDIAAYSNNHYCQVYDVENGAPATTPTLPVPWATGSWRAWQYSQYGNAPQGIGTGGSNCTTGAATVDLDEAQNGTVAASGDIAGSGPPCQSESQCPGFRSDFRDGVRCLLNHCTPPVPGSCAAGFGWYCGDDGIENGSSTLKNHLYFCPASGAGVNPIDLGVCAKGCVHAGANNPDYCADGTSGNYPRATASPPSDGYWCGESFTGGIAGHLYYHRANAATDVGACASGCQHGSNYSDDYCKTWTSDPCAEDPQAFGLYCGGNGLGGDPSTLYQCPGGGAASTSQVVCAHGCHYMPPGQPDACN